jgi:hypothetical protein
MTSPGKVARRSQQESQIEARQKFMADAVANAPCANGQTGNND